MWRAALGWLAARAAAFGRALSVAEGCQWRKHHRAHAVLPWPAIPTSLPAYLVVRARVQVVYVTDIATALGDPATTTLLRLKGLNTDSKREAVPPTFPESDKCVVLHCVAVWHEWQVWRAWMGATTHMRAAGMAAVHGGCCRHRWPPS